MPAAKARHQSATSKRGAARQDPDYVSPYDSWFRFSFGPLLPETFESDVAIMKETLEEYRADA